MNKIVSLVPGLSRFVRSQSVEVPTWQIRLKTGCQPALSQPLPIRTNGDWEDWLMFFLRGTAEVSQAATATAREILRLGREKALACSGGANYGQRLVDFLFERPIVNVRIVELIGLPHGTSQSGHRFFPPL
jgi:hypothetical protein